MTDQEVIAKVRAAAAQLPATTDDSHAAQGVPALQGYERADHGAVQLQAGGVPVTRCERCDRPLPTQAEWDTTEDGERGDLCWGEGNNCFESNAVDWRARALAAEAERDEANAIADIASRALVAGLEEAERLRAELVAAWNINYETNVSRDHAILGSQELRAERDAMAARLVAAHADRDTARAEVARVQAEACQLHAQVARLRELLSEGHDIVSNYLPGFDVWIGEAAAEVPQ